MTQRAHKRLDWTTAVAGHAVGLAFNQRFSHGTLNPDQADELAESLKEAAEAARRAAPQWCVRWWLNGCTPRIEGPFSHSEAISLAWELNFEFDWARAEVIPPAPPLPTGLLPSGQA